MTQTFNNKHTAFRRRWRHGRITDETDRTHRRVLESDVLHHGHWGQKRFKIKCVFLGPLEPDWCSPWRGPILENRRYVVTTRYLPIVAYNTVFSVLAMVHR